MATGSGRKDLLEVDDDLDNVVLSVNEDYAARLEVTAL
jgi:hypothetical protein